VTVNIRHTIKVGDLVTLVKGEANYTTLSPDEIQTIAKCSKKQMFQALEDSAEQLDLTIDITPEEDGWWDVKWFPKETSRLGKFFRKSIWKRTKQVSYGYGI
jgi:hypothetical protein